MNLYLLRHGIAVDRGTPGYERDSDRPLTPKGERQLKRIAKAMKKMELTFDRILTSPYLRARQTAEIVADALKLRKWLAFSQDLTPGGNPKALVEHLDQIHPKPDDLLLVGHEPYLSCLLATLVAGNSGLSIDFKKGGLCKMEIGGLRYARCAPLVWLLTPKQLQAMA